MKTSCDYVVVGGGTAGSVLAARLSEDPAVRVLLLEAGAAEGPETMPDPRAAFSLMGTFVDWAYTTTPQAGTGGTTHVFPRGKVLGGSSGINQMVHLRGHRSSYDAWEKAGATGWDYDTLLPYLMRSERVEGGDPTVRGHHGPMRIEPEPMPTPLSKAWFDAALEAGHSPSEDGNGHATEGVSWTDHNIVDGLRQSASDAYIRPVRSRPNLQIVTRAHVIRLLFDAGSCVGAEYVRNGMVTTARADREVVLAAGTVGSAHLLLLSGIGPAAQLRRLGIDVRADLPGVGENLQDHVLSRVGYTAKAPLYEDGPSPMPHVLARSDEAGDPDLQIAFADALLKPRWAGFEPGGISVTFALMTPHSRGTIRLADTDPLGPPLIDPAYFSDGRDLDTMVSGLRMARRIGGSQALSSWRGEEVQPGPEAQDASSLRDYIRASASTYFHPVGTCRMGTDDLSVVDPDLKVQGIEGLRVADASVIPIIVSANTNATVLAVAERAADLLKGNISVV